MCIQIRPDNIARSEVKEQADAVKNAEVSPSIPLDLIQQVVTRLAVAHAHFEDLLVQAIGLVALVLHVYFSVRCCAFCSSTYPHGTFKLSVLL